MVCLVCVFPVRLKLDLTKSILSCTSPAGNLDKPDPMLRSTEHTNVCKAAFSSKTLWETYGIVSDATVSLMH